MSVNNSGIETRKAQLVNDSVSAGAVSQANATGKLDGLVIVLNKEVDPTTKDDEVAAGILSEKKAQKEKTKKLKEQKDKTVTKVVQAETVKGSLDRDKRGKLREKQAALRFALQLKENNEKNISERSNQLFPETKEFYEKAFKKLNTLSENSPESSFLTMLDDSGLSDIAERHNALIITKDNWESEIKLIDKELAEIEGELADFDESNASPEGKEEHKSLMEQKQAILNLKSSVTAKLYKLTAVIDKMMQTNSNRINDSYKLAPKLRKLKFFGSGGITDSPKDINALILDDILGLCGDKAAIFKKLLSKLLTSYTKEKDNE